MIQKMIIIKHLNIHRYLILDSMQAKYAKKKQLIVKYQRLESNSQSIKKINE